jgi:hypothetical protein
MLDNISHADALNEAGGLSAVAIDWARNVIPFEIYPRSSLDRFPRIINKIAALWREPAQFRPYMDDLLCDERGDRQGCPFDILVELTNLRQEHDRQYPDQHSVFDEQFDQFSNRL